MAKMIKNGFLCAKWPKSRCCRFKCAASTKHSGGKWMLMLYLGWNYVLACYIHVSVSQWSKPDIVQLISNSTSEIQPCFKADHISLRNPPVEIHNQCNFCLTLICSYTLPCPLYCSVVPALKAIILISSYLISFIYFNHSVQEAPVIPRASAFSWHSGRDIHTTVLNDCAGVQALRAHLGRAAGPFDLWILQMKSRGETETNHLRFWESFRSDWLFILIGGEKGLIFARAERFRFSSTASVCDGRVSPAPEDW